MEPAERVGAIGCAAWAAATLSLPLVFLASAVLGAGYSLTQFAASPKSSTSPTPGPWAP